MLDSNKVLIDDILILQESLQKLNQEKYVIDIEMVEPFEDFLHIANTAHQIILDNINQTVLV